MKRQKKTFEPVAPLKLSGTITDTVQSSAYRFLPTVTSPTVNTYIGNVRSIHERSATVQGARDSKGWRYPTAYRLFAARTTGDVYNFDYSLTGADRWNLSGTTDVRGGIGPASGYEYWATKVVGGLRYPDVSSNLINQVTTEALLKLQDQKYNLLADLAESVSNVGLLTSQLIRVARSLQYARRGRFSQALRILGQAKHTWSQARSGSRLIAEGWLAWSYAFKPLYEDILATVELFKKPIRHGIISGTRRIRRNYGLPGPDSTYLAGGFWNSEGRAEVGCQVILWAELDSLVISLIQSLGLINPMALGWELSPFSFVVDWLFPFGNVLQALTADMGIKYKSGSQTERSWCDFSITGVRSNWKAPSGVFPKAHYRNTAMKRSVLSTMPLPRLYVKSPFSVNHIMSFVALLDMLTKPGKPGIRYVA